MSRIKDMKDFVQKLILREKNIYFWILFLRDPTQQTAKQL